MKNFKLNNQGVRIFFKNNSSLFIYFTSNSGKVYYRKKIDTITGINHPGIFLGIDEYRRNIFIHNHFEIGTAGLVTQEQFSKGQIIYEDFRKSNKTKGEILKNSLIQVQMKEPYHFINYNCQTMVNKARNGKSESEDVDKWVGLSFLGIAVIGFTAFVTSK